MNTLGYEQAMQLRTALVPIAYLLCTTGLLLSVLRNWGNFQEILMTLVGILVIVVFINGFPSALTTVADGFKQLRQQTTANPPGGGWQSVFQVDFEKPAWNQIAEKIAILLCQMFKAIGQVSIWFLDWVQAWAFDGLIAISPVLLGALAVPWTQGAGTTFLITSFGVAAWHLGIALVDILLADIATQLFAAAGLGGGVATGTTIALGVLPVFLGALVAIVLVGLAMYLAVPILIAAVLRGSSPLTTGAKAGIEMALTGFGMTTMAGGTIAAKVGAMRSGDDVTQKRTLFPQFRQRGRGDSDDGDGGTPRPSTPPRGPVDGGKGLAAPAAPVAPESADGGPAPRPGRGPSPAGPAPSARRQTEIVAEYDAADGALAPRRPRNELVRRQSEARRVLGDLDKNYT